MIDRKPLDCTTREEIFNAKVLRISGLTAVKKRSIRNYFESGDIKKYLSDEKYIDLDIAMFLAPQHAFSHFIERFSLAVEWLIKNKDHKANFSYPRNVSLDHKVQYAFSCLFTEYGALLPPALFAEVFDFSYGEKFVAKRQLDISIGRDKYSPTLERLFIGTFVRLLQKLNSNAYLGLKKQRISTEPFVHALEYFIGMIPDLPVRYLALKLFDDSSIESERDRINQFNVRTLIANVNLVLTDEHTDYGLKQVPIDNQFIHDQLVDAFASAPYQQEYNELVNFLKSRGEDCVYETI